MTTTVLIGNVLALISVCILTAILLFLGSYLKERKMRKRYIVLSDKYTKTTGVKTDVQLKNACAVKLANEIRKSGAMQIEKIGEDEYRVTIVAVKLK